MPARDSFSLDSLGFPPEFLRHNQDDPGWLRTLPDRLAELASRWSLTLGPHFPELSFNFVCSATGADGTPCVLKVSRHLGETGNEIAALHLWDGDGAARLLAADPDRGALLLERLDPGTMLTDEAETDDDAATLIAAGVLRQLWRPVPDVPSGPERSGLRPLESWCAGYDRNRESLTRGDGGFPAALFQRADTMRRDLLASTDRPSVLHGDLHHYNVLRAQRAEWLAIDPKGLTGDRAFDICQFLSNPHEVTPAMRSRRVDIFCAELDLDRPRTKDWCFVHAMLDACWDFEDGNPWQRAVAYAEEMLAL
jgi:streptomycin 6-kinase